MDRLSVSLSDYGFAGEEAGFGSTTSENVDLLNKALSAGDITGRETANMYDASGAPLKVESLEKTLKHITFRQQDIRLWKDLPKKPAYNTVEEFNQQVSYGMERGGFNAEGELPEEEDSIFVRRAQHVKYLGITKSVTHQMTLVNTMIGNAVQKAINDGTMWILRALNKALYFGDERKDSLQFNGYLAQQEIALTEAYASYAGYMNSEHVVDMRGSALTEDAIESGANTIVENFALANSLYAPPAVLSNFVKNFYGNKFIMPNTAALTNGTMGQNVQNFASQFGNIALNYDVFFKKLPAKLANVAATSIKAPGAPTVGTPTVGNDIQGSKWSTGDAGNVFYGVTAMNRYGESAMTVTSAAVAAVTNGAIDIPISAGTGTYAPTAYRIYRGMVGADATALFYPLFDVSIDDVTRGYDGSGAGNVRDMNRYLPNCDQAWLTQFDTEVVEFAQLAPLMKMDLAILSPAFRFMVLLYGVPFLYAPRKMVRIINIGTNLK
jgi:hypothetical protein